METIASVTVTIGQLYFSQAVSRYPTGTEIGLDPPRLALTLSLDPISRGKKGSTPDDLGVGKKLFMPKFQYFSRF